MELETVGKTKKLTDKVTPVEIASYACMGGGNAVGQYMYNNFSTYFYTNVAGIDPLVTGTFMTVCKIIDFFTDIFMGVLVDQGKSKSGEKARPWMLRGVIPYSIGLILMFSAPFTGASASLIWAIATFIFATAICFTMNIVPFQAMLPMLSNDRQDRTKFEVAYAVFAMVVMIVAGVSVQPLSEKLGGGKTGWLLTAVILAVVAFVFHLVGYLGTKERVHVEKPKKESSGLSTLQELKYLFSNKYYIIMVVSTFLSGLNTMNASMIYYAQYVVQDMSVLAYMMVLNMAPMLIMLFIIPMIVKRFDKRLVWIIGMAVALVGLFMMYVLRENRIAFFVGMALSAFGVGSGTGTTMSFMSDAIDYGELKTGVRTVGMAFSLNLSIQKVSAALQSLLLGALLTWGEYDASLAVQGDKAVTAIVIAFAVLPVILTIGSLLCAFLMNIEKKYPNMAQELAARRGTAGAAEQ